MGIAITTSLETRLAQVLTTDGRLFERYVEGLYREQILLYDAPAVVAALVECLMHCSEVDAALARLNHDILGYSLGKRPLVFVHLCLDCQIAVLEVDVRDTLRPLLVEGNRLAAAVYMVTGVEAQIYIGVVQEALNLLLSLNVAVNMRVEQTDFCTFLQ